jgi:hypothetical protein
MKPASISCVVSHGPSNLSSQCKHELRHGSQKHTPRTCRGRSRRCASGVVCIVPGPTSPFVVYHAREAEQPVHGARTRATK